MVRAISGSAGVENPKAQKPSIANRTINGVTPPGLDRLGTPIKASAMAQTTMVQEQSSFGPPNLSYRIPYNGVATREGESCARKNWPI